MKTAPIPKVAKLPRPILNQLVKRFESSHLHGYTFENHAQWLKDKGYPISRSVIHRFCGQLREVKASNPDGTDILAVYLDKVEQSRICL
ncbi:Protein of unknown function (DUF3486) (plasmid) [Synechococcus sp. PCC 7502]|uniref:phage protein Gp27 family protein n=1 Tax=Synechococcus sp. PCC 7502 TaxID=1173263 RepID=UPI00029F99E4|nr:phage protein Gp27 family protein [Synechococcus sp. PCC 7502]AFY75490.1 Protein of unknown function (DUF3486) [Synechococcus sp. PCC 7502]